MSPLRVKFKKGQWQRGYRGQFDDSAWGITLRDVAKIAARPLCYSTRGTEAGPRNEATQPGEPRLDIVIGHPEK